MLLRALVLAALLGAAGCSWLPWVEAERNVDNSRHLRVGMTKSQVHAQMGEPVRGELFCRPDVWFYYRETLWADGLVTEDECLPLVFENGKLAGWGNAFYAKYRTTVAPGSSEVQISEHSETGSEEK